MGEGNKTCQKKTAPRRADARARTDTVELILAAAGVVGDGQAADLGCDARGLEVLDHALNFAKTAEHVVSGS